MKIFATRKLNIAEKVVNSILTGSEENEIKSEVIMNEINGRMSKIAKAIVCSEKIVASGVYRTKTIREMSNILAEKHWESGIDVYVKWEKGPQKAFIYKEDGSERFVVSTEKLFKCVKGATKPPSFSKLEKMSDVGVASSVLGKRVEPDGTDEYGSPSWILVMGLI